MTLHRAWIISPSPPENLQGLFLHSLVASVCISITSEHEQSFLFTSHCCFSEWNVYSGPCPFFSSNSGLWPSRVHFVVIQLLSRVLYFTTPWTAAHQASLSFTISRSLLKLMSIESVMPSHHLFLCRPLLLLPSVVPSHRVFSKVVAKTLELQLSVLPMNIWLIPCRIDWFDLLTV